MTILSQTPSALSQLVLAESTLPAPVSLSLRLLFCGGEPLDIEAFRDWLRRREKGHPLLVNVYGPTEATVLTTCRAMETEELAGLRGSPIGRPIAHQHVYVLDRNLQPVPVGVAGELCIGGSGVARGYLNQPGLTAERFIPDPFSGEPGARLYRTGDIVTHRPDGELLILGRADHQTKVRGFRIELGEIEATLRRHPDIRDCVAVVRADGAGNRRIAAYAVLAAPEAVSAGELGEFLRHRLPDFMIPSDFVVMERFPLTANGKVDRRSLPDPEPVRPELASRYAEPRTEVEVELARLWREILGLDRVGIHDDFFDLGGHSLVATRLVSRIRDCLHLELTVRAVFEAPTIAGMAAAVETARSAPGSRATQPVILRRRDRIDS